MDPSRRSLTPATKTPNAAHTKWPEPIKIAVTTDASSPKTVSASAGIPSRRRPRPNGPSTRSTPPLARPSSMGDSFGTWWGASLRSPRSRPRALSKVPPAARTPAHPPTGPERAPFLQSPDGTQPRGSRVKTFPTANIRNVALVGHGGAGKTSLAEALLLAAGSIPRLGKVEDGSTVCDFDPEEQRRRI